MEGKVEEIYNTVAPDINRPIMEQIQVLEKESLETSLENLKFSEMYYWPGSPVGYSPGGGFPLKKEHGSHEIWKIISNRRFLKVYDSLSLMPKKQMEEMLVKQLERFFASFKHLYSDFKAGIADQFKDDEKAPILYISSSETGDINQPSLEGYRLGVLSLLLIAGNLEVKGAENLISRIIDETVEEYKALQDPRIKNKFLTLQLATSSLVYNRQILGTALIGVSTKRENQKGIFQWEEQILTKYNARATGFDLHARIGAVPIDFSKGKLMVRFITPVDDFDFQVIVKKYSPEK